LSGLKDFNRAMRSLALAASCFGLLVACNDNPETMIASAKEYLAKNDTNAAAIQLKNALQKNGDLAEARFLLGRVNLEQGNVAGALKELRRAAERGYPEAQISSYLARALVQSGEFDKAIKDFEGRKLEDPVDQARLDAALGDAYLAKSDLKKARASYDAAVAADPANMTAPLGLARAKLFAGDADGALAGADANVAAKPDMAEAHALRARVLTMRKQDDAAIAAMEAAVKAQPSAVNYHFALVSMLLRQNQLEPAAARLEAMKKVAPKHPSTRYLQALLDLRNNKINEARDNAVEVTRLAPDFLPGRLLAGTIYVRLNQPALAQEHLGAVLSRAPRNSMARRMLATSQLVSGEPGRALTTLQPLLDAPQVDNATMTLAGRILIAKGEFDRAAEYFGKVAAADPEDASARTRLGVSRLMAGDAGQAFTDLEAASDLESDGGQADLALVLAHLRRGEFDKALAAQQQLESKQPDDPQTHTLKGGILLGKKDTAGARVAFERALKLRPDYVAAAVNLARMDIAEGHPAEARSRFETIVKANPKNVEAHLLLAELLAETGAPPAEVRSALDRASAANPAAIAPKIALTRHYLKEKEPKKALTVAQELASAHATDPQALGMLARAQLAAGEQQQAIASLNGLAGLLPQSPGPLLELSDLQRIAKDRVGAEQTLRKVLGFKPDLLEAQQRLASLMVEDKRMSDALGIARTVQRQRPKAAAGLLLEADIETAAGHWPQAAAALRKALERESSAPAAVKLHMVQTKAGKTADAEKTASDWLRAQPKDIVFRSYLGERALAERRFDDAEKLYQKVVELSPNNAQALNNLASIMGKRQDPKAIPIAERALKLAPNNPAILDTLGMLQVEQGKEGGLENLLKAVSLAPDTAILRLNLSRAYLKLGRKDDARKELEGVLKQAAEGTPLHAEATSLKQGL
jgi:putative PEP-CTERM system TPR-repeat lipoprotein